MVLFLLKVNFQYSDGWQRKQGYMVLPSQSDFISLEVLKGFTFSAALFLALSFFLLVRNDPESHLLTMLGLELGFSYTLSESDRADETTKGYPTSRLYQHHNLARVFLSSKLIMGISLITIA